MVNAKGHLTELAKTARGRLKEIQSSIDLRTREIEDIDGRLGKIDNDMDGRYAKILEIEDLLYGLCGRLKKEKTQLRLSEQEETRLVGEIWYDTDQYLRNPADLVLLMNPASDAVVSLDLLKAMSGRDVADEVDVAVPPAIVSITSKGDRATKGLFPIGNWLGRMARLGPRAQHGEWGLAYGTLGHQSKYVTHEVKSIKERTNREVDVLTFSVGSDEYFMEYVPGRDWEKDVSGKEPDLDYWVVTVPRDVIADHEHIFCAKEDDDYCSASLPAQSKTDPSRKPLLGVVEGWIEHWQLFEPRCVRKVDGGKVVCGRLEIDGDAM